MLRATEIIVLGDGPSHRLDGQIDAIDPASRTLRMLGIEFVWSTETSGTLANRGVGDWISVQAHGNRFVRSISGSRVGISTIEGEWIRDISPPIGFTLDSVVDLMVQVTPSASFALSYLLGDGDCYGWDLLSSDQFFHRLSEPRPAGYTSLTAQGRFESGILIADDVWLCH